MGIIKSIVFIIIICGITFSAWAATHCEDLSGQSDMNICATDRAKTADKNLDQTYKKLMAKISSTGQVALQSAQEAWTTYRSEQCSFNTMGSEDGSVHGMVLAECYEYMARQRTKELDEQLNCAEGNMSCGNQ